jgi:hypothetical protein
VNLGRIACGAGGPAVGCKVNKVTKLIKLYKTTQHILYTFSNLAKTLGGFKKLINKFVESIDNRSSVKDQHIDLDDQAISATKAATLVSGPSNSSWWIKRF